MDLAYYDRETLARWWCELNAFRWPRGFPEPEPPDYHAMSDREKYDDPRCRAAWEALNAVIPQAEALAYWNGPFMQGRRAQNIATARFCWDDLKSVRALISPSTMDKSTPPTTDEDNSGTASS